MFWKVAYSVVPPAEYTVTFDDNYSGQTLSTQTVQSGKTMQGVEEPTREGYAFLGWFQDATLNTPWDTASSKVEGDTTLYAGWDKDTGDTITDGSNDKDFSALTTPGSQENAYEYKSFFLPALDGISHPYVGCPDFFPLDGKRVLLVSPQEMSPIGLEFHAGHATLCLIGNYDAETNLHRVEGRLVDMTVTICPAERELYHSFRINVAKDGEYVTSIRYRPNTSILKIDRTRSGSNADVVHTRSLLVRPQDGHIKLRILLDRCSVEVFVNDGEQAVTASIITRQSADSISFDTTGSVLMDVEKYDIDLNRKGDTF